MFQMIQNLVEIREVVIQDDEEDVEEIKEVVDFAHIVVKQIIQLTLAFLSMDFLLDISKEFLVLMQFLQIIFLLSKIRILVKAHINLLHLTVASKEIISHKDSMKLC